MHPPDPPFILHSSWRVRRVVPILLIPFLTFCLVCGFVNLSFYQPTVLSNNQTIEIDFCPCEQKCAPPSRSSPSLFLPQRYLVLQPLLVPCTSSTMSFICIFLMRATLSFTTRGRPGCLSNGCIQLPPGIAPASTVDTPISTDPAPDTRIPT